MINNKNDYEKYDDIEGVTFKKLFFGLWYIEHRALLIKLGLSSLGLVGLVTWMIFFYYFGSYIFKGMKEDENILQQITDKNIIDHTYIKQSAAQELELGQPRVFRSSGQIDFIAQVKNPNSRHWAEFVYYFHAGSQKIGARQGFIMPGESKYLFALGQDAALDAGSAQLVLEDVVFSRVNPHIIPDWTDYYNKHMALTVSDISYQSDQKTSDNRIETGRLEFGIYNGSPYNYWSVGLNIIFLNFSNPVGAYYYKITEFKSEEDKNIKITVFNPPANIDEVLISPEINILNQKNYMNFEAEASLERR